MKKYGVEIIPRPAIKATKRLDLNGKMGEEMIKSLTKLILIRHQKAFKRLSVYLKCEFRRHFTHET
ncbi:acetyltransferase [Acinetobacter piscicola]|uniref:acetyltransferase n=1 Tax=Acinetobacter piscicola TaxID=2006115 RepID=UPI000B7CADFE|nr:acetyltransferase [Acinetobacter piscicola]